MALNGRYGIGLLISGQEAVSGAAQQASNVINAMVASFATAFNKMQRDMAKARAGVETFQSGMNILRKSFNLALLAGDVEQELVAVQAIMGVTTEKMKELEAVSTEAGMKTQFSSLQAAQALRSLAQAGMDADSAMQVLRPSLDLAAASLGKLSPTDAAGVANATLKAFGLEAGDTRTAMNALVNATNRFNISVEQLPIGIANLSRGTISLKQSMDDSLIALGLVKNVLPQMSKAATLTSSGMLRIADPSIQKQLNKLGITFKDQQGNFLPFIEILMNMDQVLGKKFPDAAQRTGVAVKLLGKQGLVPFNTITKQLTDGIKGMDGQTYKGAEAIAYMRLQFKAAQGSVAELIKLNAPAHLIKYAEEVKKSGGASGDFVAKLLGTFKGQVTLLAGAWGIFLETVGKPFSQVLKPFVSFVYDRLGDIIEFIQQMDPVTKRWMAGLVVGVGAAIALWGAFVAVKFALLAISPFAAGIALALGKVLLIAAALGAVGYLVWKAWQRDLFWVKTLVGGFFEGFMDGFMFLRGAWSEVLPVLKAAFLDVFNAINEVLAAFGVKTVGTSGTVKDAFVFMGQIVGATVAFIIRAIAGVIGFVANFIAMLTRLLNIAIRTGRYIGSFVGLTTAPKDLGVASGVTATAQGFGRSLGLSDLSTAQQLVLPRPNAQAPATPNVTLSPVINVQSAPTTLQVNGRELAKTVQEERDDAMRRAYKTVVREYGL